VAAALPGAPAEIATAPPVQWRLLAFALILHALKEISEIGRLARLQAIGVRFM
jgi:hypothetical protein